MEFSFPFQSKLASINSAKVLEEYEKIISNLPKEDGWVPLLPLFPYQGFWFFSIFLKGAMYVQDHFKAQPTDILLCSSMKTGSAWLKALSFSIVTRTQFNSCTSPLKTTFTHHCIPFLEYGELSQGPEFPLLATHMPYTCLAESVIDSGCKIVYLCRDPKDTFVSMWHFLKETTQNFLQDQLNEGDNNPIITSMEDAFELFCKGISVYGPYWEHVLGYWKASLEHPEKILFLKYEDMMKNPESYAKRLAEFLGCPFSLDEERGGKIQEIIKLCSFESLSNIEVNKSGKHQVMSKSIANSAYFRKGKVGDWRNYLTTEMGERLDSLMEQKLSGSGLTFRHI